MDNLLVVDVQPQYHQWCGPVASRVAQAINECTGNVIIMFVGEDFSEDTAESVREYLVEHGASEEALDCARFIEKDYGFFRGWMDSGVSHDAIISVARYMKKTRIWESEDIDPDTLATLADDDSLPNTPIRLPHFDDSSFSYIKDWKTCGGGSEECLREIEIWLAANDHQFDRVCHLTY